MERRSRPSSPGSRFTRYAGVLLVVLLLGPSVPSAPLAAPRRSFSAPRPLGCLFAPPGRWTAQAPALPAEVFLPGAVDLSVGLPPVGDQGTQASCVGWATTYYYKTYQEQRERGWDVTDPDHILSPAYVFNQICVEYPGGVGAYIGDAWETLISQGSAPWSQFPYTAADYRTQPTYEQRRAALPYQSLAYGAFFLSNIGDPRTPTLANNDLQPLKNWLAGGNPVVLAIPVYAEFDAPAGPYAIVTPPANTFSYRGGHAVMLVGYDDNIGGTGMGGFKFVNSWGVLYGAGGYGYLAYDFVRQYTPEAWWMTDRVAQGPYHLCGHVWNVAGQPLIGARLTIGGALTVTTSHDGFYGWGGLAGGDRKVIPTKPGYTFNPTARWVMVAGDVTGVDFTGTAVNTGTLNCQAVIEAGGGGVFTGDTTGALANVKYYNCEKWNESGPEHVYRITSSRTGLIRATLHYPPGPGTDLDVFILAACDETTCLMAGSYLTAGIDQATITNAPLGAYYIVVDGYNGAHGPYTLFIEAPVDRPYSAYLPLIMRHP